MLMFGNMFVFCMFLNDDVKIVKNEYFSLY